VRSDGISEDLLDLVGLIDVTEEGGSFDIVGVSARFGEVISRGNWSLVSQRQSKDSLAKELTIVLNVNACTGGKDSEGALAVLLGDLRGNVLDFDTGERGALSFRGGNSEGVGGDLGERLVPSRLAARSVILISKQKTYCTGII